MKSNSICRINDSKLFPVLITNNHIINQYDILCNKTIPLYLNNYKMIKTIKLNNNRLKYINEKLDITIIEIPIYI